METMLESEKTLLRHFYAAAAMHAMIIAENLTQPPADAPEARAEAAEAIESISSAAIAMADKMMEKAGPIE